MALATPAAVQKQIDGGKPDPVYLILGEDELEKSALASAFADLVEEGLRAFNVERIHAGDWTTGDALLKGVASIVAAVRTLPMMSPRRIVCVLQAEAILLPKRESDAAERAVEQFRALLEAPETSTTLVLVSATIDKRSKMFKTLTKTATIVECGVLEGPDDAEYWVHKRIAAAGVEADPAATRLLAERGGADVKRLRADVDRLLLYAMGKTRITVDDVREVSGPAVLQDHWAMTNAIERGQEGPALKQLALMLDAGSAPEMILGQLGWLVRTKFVTIAPSALRGAVDSLFRTDLDLKRSAGDPRVTLERLVVELCAGRTARRGRSGAW